MKNIMLRDLDQKANVTRIVEEYMGCNYQSGPNIK